MTVPERRRRTETINFNGGSGEEECTRIRQHLGQHRYPGACAGHCGRSCALGGHGHAAVQPARGTTKSNCSSRRTHRSPAARRASRARTDALRRLSAPTRSRRSTTSCTLSRPGPFRESRTHRPGCCPWPAGSDRPRHKRQRSWEARASGAGALDALYTAAASNDVHLGVSYSSGVPSLAVWAPTALKNPGVKVKYLRRCADTTAETFDMTLDDATGVWSVTGTSDWNRKFYTISLKVYSYAANAIVTQRGNGPVLREPRDGQRAQPVRDLNDADLKPAGWDTLQKPELAAPEDIVLYDCTCAISASRIRASRRPTAAFTALGRPRHEKAASTCSSWRRRA